MQVTWEADDIKPGRRYWKPGAKERWIIGYIAGDTGRARYVSVSASDGMVTAAVTKEQLAAELTAAGYLPAELCAAQDGA